MKLVPIKAQNGQVYYVAPNTKLTDFVLWAATEAHRVKWVRPQGGSHE
jgi:hypothetical protein